ncbi:DNA replication complex GINS protein sld5 [Gracilaria domingensis]|nr:DNA replication complex GINS protein sld5 [Gracilaria domingensis]
MALAEEQSNIGRAQSRLPNGPEGDDPSQVGLNEAIDMMAMLARNEQFSPEILPYENQTIEVMRTLVDQQSDLVDEEDDTEDSISFESQLKRLEIDRINYTLRHYFRVRIKKIEENILFLFKNADMLDQLSDAEKTYASGYKKLLEDHFKKSFLSMLPQKIQVVEKDGSVEPDAGPSLDRFVFCRVRDTVGRVAVGEDAMSDAITLNQNDILCVRYKTVAELLKSEAVELL